MDSSVVVLRHYMAASRSLAVSRFCVMLTFSSIHPTPGRRARINSAMLLLRLPEPVNIVEDELPSRIHSGFSNSPQSAMLIAASKVVAIEQGNQACSLE